MVEKYNQKLLQFLNNIGNDENSDGSPAWPECDDTGQDAKNCDGNCGKCRYDWMAKKCWLNSKYI